jgi:hypothetical protein
MARTGKPLIMSTGMASLEEVEEAVNTARAAGATHIALLKCTSAYPALPEEMNLRTIPELSTRFNVPAGLSDHTMGVAVPVAAVALGACIIEKHLTLSRSMPGPDSAFSLEPAEFKAMVDAIRTAEKSLGRAYFGASAKEASSRVFRRSLFVVADVRHGELFTEENVRSIRPGHGLHPRHFSDVLGKRAAQDIERGTPLSWDWFSIMRFFSPFLKRVVYPGLSSAGFLRRHARLGQLCVVTYHGVLPSGYKPIDSALDGGLVAGDVLRSQIQLLKSRYNVVSPNDVRRWIRQEAGLPSRALLLTCDDGLENTLTEMLPILQREQVGCLFFVTGCSRPIRPRCCGTKNFTLCFSRLATGKYEWMTSIYTV